MITAPTPLTNATERSISAIRSTKTTPIAIVVTPAIWSSRLTKFALGAEAVLEAAEEDRERGEAGEDRQRAPVARLAAGASQRAPGLGQRLADARGARPAAVGRRRRLLSPARPAPAHAAASSGHPGHVRELARRDRVHDLLLGHVRAARAGRRTGRAGAR